MTKSQPHIHIVTKTGCEFLFAWICTTVTGGLNNKGLYHFNSCIQVNEWLMVPLEFYNNPSDKITPSWMTDGFK